MKSRIDPGRLHQPQPRNQRKSASTLQDHRPANLIRHIHAFPRINVLVVGDLMLDHYIWGSVTRISPEAPVPVVHVESESLCCGGAANVFQNIAALGGRADLCGVIGKDAGGHALLKKLGLSRSSHKGILIDETRPTTKKTRIIAHNQQVVRYDVERRHGLSQRCTGRLLRYIESRLPEISCLVVSDYAKGVITAPLMAALTRMAGARHIPIVVDPKVEHFPYYAGVTVITPNHLEAQQGASLPKGVADPIPEAGHYLRQKLGCEAVLVTRGEQGMTLCESTGNSWHIPTMARQVYDVTGAGDTVVGTMALALGSRASLREGAILANHAAGLVVGMVGTATVSALQLRKAVQDGSR